MKWLRYCILVSLFIIFSPMAIAGKDPIYCRLTAGSLPANTNKNQLYDGIVYTCTNQLPYTMITPLYIEKFPDPAGEFTIIDGCSGSTLASDASCIVTISLFPTTAGTKSIALAIEYGRNVVPLPALTTTTGSTPPPPALVTGTASTPLPVAMGAGERRAFVFTYKNNTTGKILNLATPVAGDVTVSGTGINGSIVVGSFATTCQAGVNLPDFPIMKPGESCTVSGTLQAGTAGTYIVSNTLSYTGGLTPVNTTTTASVNVIGEVIAGFPSPMGAGETNTLTFRFTNTDVQPTDTVYGVAAPTFGPYVTGTGGSTVNGPACAATLAPGAFCDLTVTFTSGLPIPSPYSAAVSFNYLGGVIPLQIQATGSPLVTGVASTPLPSSMGFGESQNVVFTFTNGGSGSVTFSGATMVTTTPGGVWTPTVDGCNGDTLVGIGDTCMVTGTFTSNTTGSHTVTAKVNYVGNIASAQTTTNVMAATLVGSVVQELPDDIGAGESGHIVQFAFTNTGSGNITIPNVDSVVTVIGGTRTITGDSCKNATLTPGQQCLVTASFSSGPPGNYSLTGKVTYAGGVISAGPTTATGVRKVVGVVAPGLPATVGLGEMLHVVEFVYTNNSDFTAYGIPACPGFNCPTHDNSVIFSGGVCLDNANSGLSTDCGTTLAPHASCQVACDYFIPKVAGAVAVSSTLTYGGGTTPVVTTTSTASQKVIGAVPIDLPASGAPSTTYPISFTFTNTGLYPVSGGAVPTLTVSPVAGTLTATTNSGCTAPLNPGLSCVANGTLLTASTDPLSYTVYATYTYDGGTIVRPSTQMTASSSLRAFTFNNYCDKDVWFSFMGAEVRKGCSDKNPCPTGSLCNKSADNGKGVCYWNTPMPGKNGFHLTPIKGMTPASMQVLIRDADRKNSTIWSGSIMGRTGCKSGKDCETGDSLTLPVTMANMTLKRDTDDQYSLSVVNGINLTMSVGPTEPAKTSPAYDANSPFYCATPGSSDASRIFKACGWVLNPIDVSGEAVGYLWVKPGIGGACSSNTSCPKDEVCGLSFNSGGFAKVCGTKLGYWTPAQACLLNASSASAYFDCKSVMTQPTEALLKDLNTCTNADPKAGVSALPQACANSANAARASQVQWLKNACSSVSAFLGDTANSRFTCGTYPEFKGTNGAVVKSKLNVTNYTVTFCPELAPTALKNTQQAK